MSVVIGGSLGSGVGVATRPYRHIAGDRLTKKLHHTQGQHLALLTRRQVAQVSGFALQTLKQWRNSEKGPRYINLEGCVRYRVADVRAWLGRADG